MLWDKIWNYDTFACQSKKINFMLNNIDNVSIDSVCKRLTKNRKEWCNNSRLKCHVLDIEILIVHVRYDNIKVIKSK